MGAREYLGTADVKTNPNSSKTLSHNKLTKGPQTSVNFGARATTNAKNVLHDSHRRPLSLETNNPDYDGLQAWVKNLIQLQS